MPVEIIDRANEAVEPGRYRIVVWTVNRWANSLTVAEICEFEFTPQNRTRRLREGTKWVLENYSNAARIERQWAVTEARAHALAATKTEAELAAQQFAERTITVTVMPAMLEGSRIVHNVIFGDIRLQCTSEHDARALADILVRTTNAYTLQVAALDSSNLLKD